MDKIPVAILGATGMVGQRFITLLANHPWFEVSAVAASENSAGKTYAEAVAGRWVMTDSIPSLVAKMTMQSIYSVYNVSKNATLIFSAFKAQAESTRQLEEMYARHEVVVVSANSAHRWTPDVPMIIPEVNPHHLKILPSQKLRLHTKQGCIVVKPNCSLQSFVPPLHALAEFKPKNVFVATYQAVSGAGRTLTDWPEIQDNVIPYIKGEEEKTEREPLKIMGNFTVTEAAVFRPASYPKISAKCFRVPTSDGHIMPVWVSFKHKPSRQQILDCWREQSTNTKPQKLHLPSAPPLFLEYLEGEDRPQPKLDRDRGNGMTITLGRLEEDEVFDCNFVALSHNTIRGAAGGAILTAELLKADGYLE